MTLEQAFQSATDSAEALSHPVTRLCLAIVAGAFVVVPMVLGVLSAAGKLSPKTRADAWLRYRTWLWIAPLVLVPMLWCKLGAILAITAMSLLAYREFARATGLFRHRSLSAIVVIAICAMAFAALDHWYGFFVAIGPLAIAALAGVAVLADEPRGYLQRVALAAFALMLFGSGLMHLAYFTNHGFYRPMLCLLFLCTQAGDIAAYCAGKAFGSRKAFPNTSPNKTLAGHAGALLVAGPLAAYLLHLILRGTVVDMWHRLALFGVLIGIGAQLGDLVLGSIKRDLGVKDLAHTLPGHGGVSDRVNSLLLVAPGAFHFVGYFLGIGLGQPVRIFTAGG
jgi:phosphatidate cytidylyltransferase